MTAGPGAEAPDVCALLSWLSSMSRYPTTRACYEVRELLLASCSGKHIVAGTPRRGGLVAILRERRLAPAGSGAALS